MLRIRWRFLLPLFTSLMFSTLIHAQDEIAEDSKVIYLRENSCWGIYTYLDVLDSQKNKTGYYQNALSSFNSDIYLYDQSKNLVLSTDIKSFGKVRKQIYIHDSNKKVIARVEQEIFNKVGNDFVKKVLDLSSSPYRRYTIYDGSGKIVGVTTKMEYSATETVMEFWDAGEKKLFARATKGVGEKIKSLACANPVWKIELLDPEHDKTAASDTRVITTVVAIKAQRDVDAATKMRWEMISKAVDAASSLTKSSEGIYDDDLDGYPQ